MFQLVHLYMTTGKTIGLTIQIFVSKVMYLLFNMLSRMVITFLPKSKCLNFMAAVNISSDFGAPKIKSVTVSTISPSIFNELMGPDTTILVFWMLSFKPTFSKCPLILLLSIVLENKSSILSNQTSKKKQIKRTQIGKEEVKLLLLADDMIHTKKILKISSKSY